MHLAGFLAVWYKRFKLCISCGRVLYAYGLHNTHVLHTYTYLLQTYVCSTLSLQKTVTRERLKFKSYQADGQQRLRTYAEWHFTVQADKLIRPQNYICSFPVHTSTSGFDFTPIFLSASHPLTAPTKPTLSCC